MGPKDLIGFCEAFCQLVVDLVFFSSISIPVPFQGESPESSHGNASLSEFPVRDGPKWRSTATQQATRT
jgi:hypothetical protein